ncbi:hypothetical protein ASF28_18775 [Methylobacterium sp. Leaf99]|uniref:hypothetical protein n=1 Tax=Methylobacterium sp. Leaf99 TaxID=1736251 RepID=UPI0006FAF1EE|nr:hypothetical protein [Methylobacterium sp. Leaf99]KQP04874.1 hypothetical protein ASF28_18775 [Methylobacterium sp. Leaf99]
MSLVSHNGRPREEERFAERPEAGLIRADFCGGIVTSGDKVSAVTAARIAFTNTAHYRDKPGRPTGAVPIWLFGR